MDKKDIFVVVFTAMLVVALAGITSIDSDDAIHGQPLKVKSSWIEGDSSKTVFKDDGTTSKVPVDSKTGKESDTESDDKAEPKKDGVTGENCPEGEIC